MQMGVAVAMLCDDYMSTMRLIAGNGNLLAALATAAKPIKRAELIEALMLEVSLRVEFR